MNRLRLLGAIVLAATALTVSPLAASLDAQTAKKPPAKPAPKPAPKAAAKPAPKPEPPAPVIALAMVNCPQVLGTGTLTQRTYCEVPIGNDAAAGIIVSFPPHVGDVRLMFDLHNRHTYSAELVKARKAYSRYTARIGVMSMNTDLLTRAIISTEFTTEADLFDRVSGGGGPGGLKAVAPTGIEAIELVIPEMHQAVSILGERLSVVRTEDVDTFTTTGRPIALISNVRVEYVPAPPPAPTPAPATTKPPAKRR
jgi:hypothetical protein